MKPMKPMNPMKPMKPINLLPRKPFVVRYQGALLRLVIVLAALILALQFYAVNRWQNTVDENEGRIVQIEQELVPTEEQRLQQSLRLAYQDALAKAEAIANAQIDWLAIAGYLLGPLPEQAQMGDVSFQANAIQAQASFPSYAAAVGYVAELEKAPLFASIIVNQLAAQGAGASDGHLLVISITIADGGGSGS